MTMGLVVLPPVTTAPLQSSTRMLRRLGPGAGTQLSGSSPLQTLSKVFTNEFAAPPLPDGCPRPGVAVGVERADTPVVPVAPERLRRREDRREDLVVAAHARAGRPRLVGVDLDLVSGRAGDDAPLELRHEERGVERLAEGRIVRVARADEVVHGESAAAPSATPTGTTASSSARPCSLRRRAA